jgi:phage-related holin
MTAIWNWLAKVAVLLLLFTRPAHDSMAAVLVLIAVDFVVGVWASKRRGEPFVSWRWRHSITRKLFPYQVAIVCALFIEEKFFAGIPLMKTIAGFIAMSEGKSIFENLGEITGLDFWTVIRERLQPAKRPENDEKK